VKGVFVARRRADQVRRKSLSIRELQRGVPYGISLPVFMFTFLSFTTLMSPRHW
jgi:hypothetical protein